MLKVYYFMVQKGKKKELNNYFQYK